MDKTPLLFIGHGSPMNAIEDNEFSREWIRIGQTLPKPAAIVCISAHWQTDGVNVTADDNPDQIYDFYGFPDELYQMKYPVKGSSAIASLIPEATPDNSWGIDHGAWSVLARLFPKADVPVVQLSLDRTKSPAEHFQYAKKLRELRQKNILIIGSGNMVHNLGLVQWQNTAYPWAIDFDLNLKKLIETNDVDSLINYQQLENSELAIPTNEHYLPLLYILALKDDDETVKFSTEKGTMGSISMRSLVLQ